MTKLFDWQLADYSKVIAGFNSNNYHAVILYPSVGAFADYAINKLVVQYLLCNSIQGNLPCNKCNSCILYLQNNHPDLFTLCINEDDKATSIKVDQVRELIGFVSTTSHTSKNKVVFIKDIQELSASINSSNSLLKILEEPPLNCYFVIGALDTSRILPTILSRASKIKLSKPNYQFAIAEMSKTISNAEFWFNYYDKELITQIPFSEDELTCLLTGLCLPSIDNVFAILKQIDVKTKYADILELLLKWLQDCLTFVMSNNASYFYEYLPEIHNILTKLDKDKLYSLEQEIIFLLEWANHPLNHKLQLENILLKYQQLYV